MSQVIACIDGSSAATAVVQAATWSASALAAPLVLFHVLEDGHSVAASDMSGQIGLGSREKLLGELAELDAKRAKLLLEDGYQQLEAAKALALASGTIADISLRQRHGGLIESLQALESDTRLLVLGLHGEDDAEHVGSQLETVLRRIQKPILLTPDQFVAPSSVMIAFDGSGSTKKAVELLAQSPLLRGMPVHVVMVGAESESHRAQLQWAQGLLTDAGHQVEVALLAGEVEPALHDYQTQHDIGLLVMGAYGHSKLRQFFVGSTTTAMLAKSKTPLLVLR